MWNFPFVVSLAVKVSDFGEFWISYFQIRNVDPVLRLFKHSQANPSALFSLLILETSQRIGHSAVGLPEGLNETHGGKAAHLC